MKITKKSISSALALTMAVSSCAVFPAHAAALNWDMRPDWTPHDYLSAMEFMNTYGYTHTDGHYICIVRPAYKEVEIVNNITTSKDDSENQRDSEYEAKTFRFTLDEIPSNVLDSDIHFYKNIQESGSCYEALMIYTDSEIDINVEMSVKSVDTGALQESVKSYSFHSDGKNVAETDIYGWLPDSFPEALEYYSKNGEISYKDGKLVYCNNLSPSIGQSIEIESIGDGKIKEFPTVGVCRQFIVPMSGGTTYALKVYDGEAEGDADVTFKRGRPWATDGEDYSTVTAHIHVNADMTVSEAEKPDIPEWIPHDQASLLKFLNEHGKTWVQDGIICCTRQVNDSIKDRCTYSYEGSAAENIKDYTIFSDNIIPDPEFASLFYEVTAYKIPENSDLTINYDYGHLDQKRTVDSFSFTKDSTGYITQNDIYSWLPDCDEEFNAYYSKHGAFSVQDGYIMYCTNIPASSGYSLFCHQNGTGEVIQDIEEYSALAEDITREGGTMHVVRLYKPITAGVVQLDLFQSRADTNVLPEQDVDTAYFKIDKDMHITPAKKSDLKTTLKGDCNCDGIVGISDAVALQNWLHGKDGVSENGNADINGDGIVDVFDLIKLKKTVINSMSEPPKPVFMNLSQNFAWSPYQYVNVYDQYGTQYTYAFHSANSEGYEHVKDSLVRLYEDNWYEQIQNIMDTAVEETTDEFKDKLCYCIKNNFAVPDRVIADITAFAENTEKYSKKEMFTVPVGNDMGGTTSYIMGETSKGKPVYAALCCVGDSAGYIKEQEVKDFVKMLVNNNMASQMIFEMTEKEGMTY